MLTRLNTRAPKGFEKDATKLKTAKLNTELAELQNVLYAENKRKVLVVFQGMDASGKDGVTKNVFKGVNPSGIRVKSFKAPSELERSYNFLWRIYSEIPRTGMIHVFNRSHYEDILVPTVHELIDQKRVNSRYEAINSFEKVLTDDNTILFKFYLHISKKEQLIRLKERIEHPEKNWKYNEADIRESRLWDKYMKVYESIFKKCAAASAWHIVPADQNWYRDYIVSKTIVEGLRSLRMKYPKASIK